MATTKVTTTFIDMSGNTGGLVWAKGTTAQRPGSPVAGDTRLNTTTTRLEFYNGTEWKRLAETAGGPTVTFLADFLVLGGGGGSGSSGRGSRDNLGGGGGGGGLRTSFGSSSGGPGAGGGSPAEAKLGFISGTSYTVTVGAAGTAAAYTGSGVNGGTGGDSVLAAITSLGGAGGGGDANNGPNGGCGGGAGMSNGPFIGGSGSAYQGFDGANGGNIVSGGGGGTGANAGSTGGGSSLSVSITGASVAYGPGGSGGNQGDNAGTTPAVNTGGGGMAGRFNGPGASGIVIVRYPNTYTITVGAGLTSSTATDGSDKVTTFTAGTDTISFS